MLRFASLLQEATIMTESCYKLAFSTHVSVSPQPFRETWRVVTWWNLPNMKMSSALLLDFCAKHGLAIANTMYTCPSVAELYLIEEVTLLNSVKMFQMSEISLLASSGFNSQFASVFPVHTPAGKKHLEPCCKFSVLCRWHHAVYILERQKLGGPNSLINRISSLVWRMSGTLKIKALQYVVKVLPKV